MEIDLDKVHLREKGMIPYEIMLSESQERMLVVCKPDREDELREIFHKWDLPAVKVGYTTSDKLLRVKYRGETVAEIPAGELVLGGGAPVYQREYRKPDYIDPLREFNPESLPEIDPAEALKQLLSSPNIASKGVVYHQYDHSVRAGTVLEPGFADAAVVRVPGTNRGLAIKTDGNGRITYLDPYLGGAWAVCESARNVVCAGGKPVAITNCLNFGNPYKPEIFYQFREAVRGMGDACRVLETPVTGGNVSFYNESPAGAVYPTPVVGMLGLLEHLNHATPSAFQNEGDIVVLLGKGELLLGGSEFLKVIHHKVAGKLPTLDIEFEKRLQRALLTAIKASIIVSAHDVSDGGLAIALAECCITGRRKQLGAKIELDDMSKNNLFSEAPSRVIVSIKPANLPKLQRTCQEYDILYQAIGWVGGNRLTMGKEIDIGLDELHKLYFNSLK